MNEPYGVGEKFTMEYEAFNIQHGPLGGLIKIKSIRKLMLRIYANCEIYERETGVLAVAPSKRW